MAHSKLSGGVGTLRETIKVLAKTRHAMTITATISILFQFPFLFAYLFVKPELLNYPQVPEVKHDAGFPWAIQSMLLVNVLVSLLFTVAIILVIATAYEGKSISVNQLLRRSVTSYFKTFITLLYFSFSIAFVFTVLSAILVLVIFSVNTTVAWTLAISVGVVAFLLFVYLEVVLFMGMVVSVVQENCYGFGALRKASRLVDGRRLDGYLLILISYLGPLCNSLSNKMFGSPKSVPEKIVLGFLLSVLGCVTQVFLYSTYTVFYFQCLKTNGEEDELKRGLEYSKLPYSDIALVSKDIP